MLASSIQQLLPLVALLLSSIHAFSPSPRISIGHTITNNQQTTLFSSVDAVLTLPEGITKTTTVEGAGRTIRAGDSIVVKYYCNADGSDMAFSRSDRQRIVAGDGSMIRGWDAAVRTMREGERATVHINNPNFGYGEEGVPPFVPPNASKYGFFYVGVLFRLLLHVSKTFFMDMHHI